MSLLMVGEWVVQVVVGTSGCWNSTGSSNLAEQMGLSVSVPRRRSSSRLPREAASSSSHPTPTADDNGVAAHLPKSPEAQLVGRAHAK